jgi:coenzyme F420 biosynthesis associated uncharacterized protein
VQRDYGDQMNAARESSPLEDSAVSWDAAARIATRLVRPGPTAPREELEALVAALRVAAGQAAEHVAELTRLSPAEHTTRVVVVDRAHWATANVAMLRAMTGTALPSVGGSLGPLARGVSAAQIGAVLAALASRVLGQFDPFTAEPPGAVPGAVPGGETTLTAPAERGRLLLVAPNVLRMERELGADPRQFRLWVCLHEQTHAAQFATAPWLAEHVRGAARWLVESLSADVSGRLAGSAALRDLAEGVVRAITEQRHAPQAGRRPDLEAAAAASPLIGAVLNPEQRRVFAELSAVMSLLEGHADVMMDAVGTDVLPGVHSIRAAFEGVRGGRGAVDQVLRRLLGLDLKLAQYRDGAAFVRAVQAAVGVDGFNVVWTRPGFLPMPEEIADPSAWVRRVHG